jgi:hypothetical protein
MNLNMKSNLLISNYFVYSLTRLCNFNYEALFKGLSAVFAPDKKIIEVERMRKYVLFVFFCLCLSVAASAQSITLDEAYANWKAHASEKNAPIQYCLASWTKKLDGKKVSMEFIAYGKISGFTLKLTPINVERDKDLKILNEAPAGEAVTARQSGSGSNSRSELNVILPVGPNANSIRIDWDFVSNGKKFSQSHVISMENEPGIDFLAVTLPVEKE